jgi:RNA polymerase sigma factor for flagellar operon FliA
VDRPEEQRRLIDDHLSWVRALASAIQREIDFGVELDELIAFGPEGLVEAAGRYDPRRGAQFKTFSYYRIRGAIYDGLRELGWLRPAEYARWRFASGANEYLANRADRAAPAGGRAAPFAEDEVDSVARAVDGLAAIFVMSIETAPHATELADGAGVPLDEALARGQQEGRVRTALSRLPDKERRILSDHYYGDLNLLEAGRRQGLSKSWASRLHARALELLAAELEAMEEGQPDRRKC